MKQRLTLASVVVGGLWLACSPPTPPPVKPASIKIATVFDVTGGTVDAIAPSWENAAVMVAEQVNDGGGVNGHPFEIVRLDSESKTDVALNRLDAGFAANKYPAVITGISLVSQAVANGFSAPNNVLQICTACTTPGITANNGSGWLYRTSPSAELQGPILAKHVYTTLGYTRVATAHSEDLFGNGVQKAFADAFRALGGTITLDKPHPQAVAASYNSDLTALAAATDGGTPQAIFLGSFINNTVKFAQDYATGGFSIPLVFPHTGRVDALLQNVDTTKLEGMGGSSNVASDGPEGDKFKAAYKARFPQSAVSLFTAASYDAAMIAALAILASGKEAPTGADLKAVLPRLNDPMGVAVGVNDFNAARAAFKEGKTINYTGASGPVDFDSTASARGRFVLWKIQAGKFVDVSTTDIP